MYDHSLARIRQRDHNRADIVGAAAWSAACTTLLLICEGLVDSSMMRSSS